MGVPERIADLRERAEQDPYNQQAWELLLGEISRGRRTDDQYTQLKEVYESLLSKFPTAASYWKEYCELEIDQGNENAVKTLFSRCLLTCLDVDLWRAYIRFIRKVNDPRAADGLAEIRQAFEFTLDHVGQDVRSGPIWQDYVTFLAAPKPGSPEYNVLFGVAQEGQEDSSRTLALRRAYQRALLVPNQALDTLWAGYERVETSGTNKTFSKRMLDEWRPKFQLARGLLKDRSLMVERLESRALPLPPGVGGPRQARLAAAWHAYLAWEIKNPQSLDVSLYHARVILAFEQVLGAMPLHQEMWLECAHWHAHLGGAGTEAALTILERGTKILPTVLALRFTASELKEASGDIEGARGCYEAIVEALEKEPEVGASQQQGTTGGDGAVDGATTPDVNATEPQPTSQQEGLPGPTTSAASLVLNPEQGTLAWIQYMRFARRVEGIMAARKLFLRARKWANLRWEAFAASAAIEWGHERKEQIPRNIFELGLKSFLTEPEYVLQYVEFLRGLGDISNTRALYERALTATPPEASAALWDSYLGFEHEVGTLQAASAVEQRRKDALGQLEDSQKRLNDGVRLAVLKYKFLDLWPGPQTHLRALMAAGGGSLGGAASLQMDYPTGEDHYESDRERDRPSSSRHNQPQRSDSFRDQRDHHQQRGDFHQIPRGRDHRGGRGPSRWDRERSRSPRPARPSSPEPIRHFPRELGQLMNSLSSTPDGPVPEIDRVIEIIARADLTPEGIVAHEVAAARERRRQREVLGQGRPGSGVNGPGGGPGGKRKAPGEDNTAGNIDYSESESDDDDEGGPGLDVYRMRRKHART